MSSSVVHAARVPRFSIGSLLAAIAISSAPSVHAEPAPSWDPGNEVTSRPRSAMSRDTGGNTDGVYGRFRGDLDFGLGLGAELGGSGTRAALRGTAHYFSTAGIYFTYREAFDDDAEIARIISVGVDLRPTFIPRWAQDMQQGPSFFDLALDSISLGLGAYWEQPRGRDFAEQRGFEMSLGFGVPLLAQATGPWIEARSQLAFAESDSARAQFLVLLSFHALTVSPLARAE